MKKTVFTKDQLAGFAADMTKIERDLRDLKTIFSVLCLQQDDKTLEVPVSALAAVPKGTELMIRFDQATDSYIFKAVVPESPDGGEANGTK